VGAVLEYGALLALLAAALLLLAAMLQRRGRRAAPTAPTGEGRGSSASPGAAEKAAAAAEGRAAAAERDAAILVELIGVGAVRVAPDLTVASANAVAHRLVGRRPGAMVGRSVLEAFTDHHADEIVRTALETGSAVGELTVRLEQGPSLLARARRTPGGDAWLVLEDVSELRRLQRIRTEFIDNLSHELRTPLTTVSLLAETLAADAGSLPPKAAERVSKIEVETGHLVQMVNELLDLSRIESGIATVALDDIDLGRLAAATADRMRLFAERQGVTLEVRVAGAVPLVRGDRERLGQALLNLLHNAVKFSPPDSVVTIRVTPAESEVVVAVEDHGQGIPRSALPRIFERFYKVDRARTRGAGGTGLGLSIARHIVEAHGGRIWAESQEGTGSTFSFAIPVTGPDLAATPGG
jgi:two-component system phosphate regulon sensor histidine kinase PhoR